MVSSGFKPLVEEWWHFTLYKEPFTDEYFDFDVEWLCLIFYTVYKVLIDKSINFHFTLKNYNIINLINARIG